MSKLGLRILSGLLNKNCCGVFLSVKPLVYSWRYRLQRKTYHINPCWQNQIFTLQEFATEDPKIRAFDKNLGSLTQIPAPLPVLPPPVRVLHWQVHYCHLTRAHHWRKTKQTFQCLPKNTVFFPVSVFRLCSTNTRIYKHTKLQKGCKFIIIVVVVHDHVQYLLHPFWEPSLNCRDNWLSNPTAAFRILEQIVKSKTILLHVSTPGKRN